MNGRYTSIRQFPLGQVTEEVFTTNLFTLIMLVEAQFKPEEMNARQCWPGIMKYLDVGLFPKKRVLIKKTSHIVVVC